MTLSDYQEHDHKSLYRLGLMAHSRAADLRKRGHRITVRRDGDLYLYQLDHPGVLSEPPIPAQPPFPGRYGTSRHVTPGRGGGSENTRQLELVVPA